MHPILQKLIRFSVRHIRALLLAPVDLGVAAVVERDDKIVLVRHSYKSGLMFPGGAVDRNEHPTDAILREMREEIGLTASAPPELVGVFAGRRGWVANVVLLYRIRDAQFTFAPSWEIRELALADPQAPPQDASTATRRRLAEIFDGAPVSHRW